MGAIGTKTFIGNSDVEKIYIYLNGSLSNFETFKRKIRNLASEYYGNLVYKDEGKLLKAFKESFPEYFKRRDFMTLSELIAVIPILDDEELAFKTAKSKFPGMDRNKPNYYDD